MMWNKAAINLLSIVAQRQWPWQSSSCSKTATAIKGQCGEEKLTAIVTINWLSIAAA